MWSPVRVMLSLRSSLKSPRVGAVFVVTFIAGKHHEDYQHDIAYHADGSYAQNNTAGVRVASKTKNVVVITAGA